MKKKTLRVDIDTCFCVCPQYNTQKVFPKVC